MAVNDLSHLLQQGAAQAWLFLPTALVLGALHGLEPGHSKTMMAAFILAIRGTIGQAVLLGISAAVSHSLVIWALAALALNFGSQWNAESTEPYFQLSAAVVVGGLALWMFWRTRQGIKAATSHFSGRSDQHTLGPGHEEGTTIRTGRREIALSLYELGIPPVFRLHFSERGKPVPPPAPDTVSIETFRPDGSRQSFGFSRNGDLLQSTADVPEPHEFEATLRLAHGDHAHTYTVPFREVEHPHHDLVPGQDFEDAHERAHALDIQKRFGNRNVTTGQIVMFGLTGGLVPCPAAFSMLVICLQIKHFTLGFALVLAFSVGLALTLVATGSLAAWSVGHAQRRFKGFGLIARKLPYVSSAFLLMVALYMGAMGWRALTFIH
jgi:nickel/cobalt transporter (NicO) family protein